MRSLLPLILGAVVAVGVLFIGLGVMKRHKYRDDPSGVPADRRDTPPSSAGSVPENASETCPPNVTYEEEYCPVDKEDTRQMEAGNTRPYIAHGHDYTEDVSRYTQQPGPEVNDVSRFTHGVGLEDDDFENRLRSQNASAPKSRPSVGSRVERRRSRRKRK